MGMDCAQKVLLQFFFFFTSGSIIYSRTLWIQSWTPQHHHRFGSVRSVFVGPSPTHPSKSLFVHLALVFGSCRPAHGSTRL